MTHFSLSVCHPASHSILYPVFCRHVFEKIRSGMAKQKVQAPLNIGGRRKFRGMQRNADIGLFALPSK
jgi:hypothetical protein